MNSNNENAMYLLFAGDAYYPSGGALDFVGTFASLEEAREVAGRPQRPYWLEEGEECATDEMRYFDWWHIATFQGGNLVIVERTR